MIASTLSPFSSDLHIRITMQPTPFGTFPSWSEKKSSHPLQTDGGFEKPLLTLSSQSPTLPHHSGKVSTMIAYTLSPFSSDRHIRNTIQPTPFGTFSPWSEKKSNHLQTDGGFEKPLLTLSSQSPTLHAKISPKVEALPLSMDCDEGDCPPEKDKKQRQLSPITEMLRNNTGASSPLKPSKEPGDDLRKERRARMEMIQLL
jgi:hypothetical protein